MLAELFSTTTKTDCDVTADSVRQLATALHRNPRYRGDPYYNQFHYKLLAGIARHEGDQEQALGHLETAMSYWPTPELNSMMVTALVAEREFARAGAFIDDAILDAPANPLKAFVWRRDLDGLRQYVREVDKYVRDSEYDENAPQPQAE